MTDPINPIRWKKIDYILRWPGKFTKHDLHEAAQELRAEVERLGGEPINERSERSRA